MSPAHPRQRGQASVEVLGVLPLLILVGLCVWQLHLGMSAATNVENAARTGSRVAAQGGDARGAALRALPPGQRGGAQITVAGELVRVRSNVPTVVPGLSTGWVKVSGDAQLPR